MIKSEVYRHWSLAMEKAFRDADDLMKVALMHPDATEGVKSFVSAVRHDSSELEEKNREQHSPRNDHL